MVAEGVAAEGYQLNTPLAASSPEAISAQFTFIVTYLNTVERLWHKKYVFSLLPLVPDTDIQKLL